MGKSKVLSEGPIAPSLISDVIAKHQIKTNIGAHAFFLGQVRADIIEGKEVKAIDYSAYNDMAEQEFYRIREESFSKYDITCMHIYHSTGVVKTGEICLFVMISSKTRKGIYKALEEIVEEIKTKVPIWGRELFDDGQYVWKKENV